MKSKCEDLNGILKLLSHCNECLEAGRGFVPKIRDSLMYSYMKLFKHNLYSEYGIDPTTVMSTGTRCLYLHVQRKVYTNEIIGRSSCL